MISKHIKNIAQEMDIVSGEHCLLHTVETIKGIEYHKIKGFFFLIKYLMMGHQHFIFLTFFENLHGNCEIVRENRTLDN